MTKPERKVITRLILGPMVLSSYMIKNPIYAEYSSVQWSFIDNDKIILSASHREAKIIASLCTAVDGEETGSWGEEGIHLSKSKPEPDRDRIMYHIATYDRVIGYLTKSQMYVFCFQVQNFDERGATRT